MNYQWRYEKLGDFTYNVLSAPQIKSFLIEWIMKEWETDHAEMPDQPWTLEWMNLLPQMTFQLERLILDQIQLRADLMRYHTAADNFLESLKERAAEREVSLLRGVSTEPLLVNRAGLELMDGYTRYLVLKKYNQSEVFAYVGTVGESITQ